MTTELQFYSLLILNEKVKQMKKREMIAHPSLFLMIYIYLHYVLL